MDTDVHIGQRISIARKRLGKTQPWLANKVGTTKQMISQYEIGRNREMKAALAIEIAAALKVDIRWLVTGKGDMDAALNNGDSLSESVLKAVYVHFRNIFLASRVKLPPEQELEILLAMCRAEAKGEDPLVAMMDASYKLDKE